MEFIDKFKRPIKVLAPMVNNSDQAYRLLSKKYGADICYTEMVHCKQFLLSKSNGESNKWFTTDNEESDLVVQLCGNDPQCMLEVGKKVQPYCDAIDINFGCPQNIAKRGYYGSYLQDDLKLTQEIVRTLSHGLEKPVFCKIRIMKNEIDTLTYARMIQDSGCKLLAVHGRTRDQKGINTGLANWDMIKSVKENLTIPVISNGNIMHPSDINDALKYTKCDGVMVAETHLYNPFIFSDTTKDCFEIVQEYLDMCKRIKTRNIELKSHVYKILHKVLETEGEIKEEINGARNVEELYEIVENLKVKMGCKTQFPTPRIRNIINITSFY